MKLIGQDVLFEITDVLGKRIRTTQKWWNFIVTHKHQEVANKLHKVKETLTSADAVYRSKKKDYIYLYYRKYGKHYICVVSRHLNGDGYIMTAYLTTKNKRKGKLIWQKTK